MSYESILVDVADAILTITLNRPDKLNAFTSTMLREMIDALDQADADDDLSAGANSFDRAARPDRPVVPTLPNGEPDLASDAARDGGGRLALRIYACLKPVIAAVNGPAVGIGATMQLPMDVRIASQ